GDRTDNPIVPTESGPHFTGLGVPQFDRLVPTGRGQSAPVRRTGNTGDVASMAPVNRGQGVVRVGAAHGAGLGPRRNGRGPLVGGRLNYPAEGVGPLPDVVPNPCTDLIGSVRAGPPFRYPRWSREQVHRVPVGVDQSQSVREGGVLTGGGRIRLNRHH